MRYNRPRALQVGVEIAAALLATLIVSPVPVRAFTNTEIIHALIAPPHIPQEAEDVAISFLDNTLPRLMADDNRLAQRLGFGDGVSNQTTIDRALPIMLIRRDDLVKLFEEGKKDPDPIDLVNNTDNWTLDGNRLVPNRIVFSLSTNSAWSSVTLERSGEGSWRIIQVGAPKLSRAIREREDQGANHFLIWLPDLNRHYLGQIITTGGPRGAMITLTTLFDDRLIRVKDKSGIRIRRAGEKFNVNSPAFGQRLKKLYEDLDLPKKLRSPVPRGLDFEQVESRP